TKVEANNYGIRKHLLEYDDVMNQQRKEIYSLRNDVLEGSGITDMVEQYAVDVAEDLCDARLPERSGPEDWDVPAVLEQLRHVYGIVATPEALGATSGSAPDVHDRVIELVRAALEQKRQRLGDELYREHCKVLTLRVLDDQWKD